MNFVEKIEEYHRTLKNMPLVMKPIPNDDSAFEYLSIVECPQCSQWNLVESPGDSVCLGCGSELQADEAILGYYYVLGVSYDADEWMEKVKGLPLVGVFEYEEEGDMEFGFSLSATGMDLSWEIGYGYLCAGCFPPPDLRLPYYVDPHNMPWKQEVLLASIAGRLWDLDKASFDLLNLVEKGKDYGVDIDEDTIKAMALNVTHQLFKGG